MKEHNLLTEQGSIYYQTGGKGEPLFFIHGNGEDGSIFYQQFEDFCPNYFVITMDTRGHGKSDLGVEKLTFAQIAKDILLVLDEQKIKAAHIIGFSDGGNIGLYLAAHFPQRVKSVVTMGANYEVDAIKEPDFADLLSERERMLVNGNNHQLNILNLMLDELDLSESDLRMITVPVLVMAGENDVIKQEHTEKMAAVIPDAELMLIPEGGHDFFYHNPASLLEAVTLFYKKLKKD